MLARSEVGTEVVLRLGCGEGWMESTYPAKDVVVVGQMRLALLAAIDPARVEVDVVSETHREQ
jgi:hypothetical protein